MGSHRIESNEIFSSVNIGEEFRVNAFNRVNKVGKVTMAGKGDGKQMARKTQFVVHVFRGVTESMCV